MGWLTMVIRNDRVLFGYLAFNAVAWFMGVRYLLKKWRDEAEIKPVQPKTQYITQETEDALKLSTLDTLLGHYNYAIRETSAKIVCDRAVNDKETVEMLLWGITRKDYDERMRNLRALAIITDSQSLERLHRWKAYAALVRSLELSLDPEQETLDQEDWDEYNLRDMSEKLCLMFISQLINCYDVEKLVKAKFVEKWLAKQNWGTTTDQRQRNFAQYTRCRNNRLNDIIAALRASHSGREALENAGLMAPASPEDSEPEDSIPLIEQFSVLLPGTITMSDLREDDPTRAFIRSLQTLQNIEDRQMRQRHREAMVLNDGTRPLNSDDIIQRDLGSPS
ncbi:Cytoskeleton-associated protein [Madurella fahalii]|uniref:Cytoskeleton-associated protein n=1 Tax=Madurella fahalii TaxID=1157608 RepID=A0ABQ0FZI2_9PEZI